MVTTSDSIKNTVTPTYFKVSQFYCFLSSFLSARICPYFCAFWEMKKYCIYITILNLLIKLLRCTLMTSGSQRPNLCTGLVRLCGRLAIAQDAGLPSSQHRCYQKKGKVLYKLALVSLQKLPERSKHMVGLP